MLELASRLADELESGWPSLARPSQLPPPGDWTIWALVMGRGAGKTRASSEWVRALVESGEGTRICVIGATAADVRDIAIEGESGILAISPEWNRPIYEPSKRRLSWPSGAIASLFSSKEPERLRGQQFTHAWCDELGAWQNQQETFDQLMFCLRLGARPRCCVTTTPRPTKVLKNLYERNGKDVVIVRESSYANRANLAPAFFAAIINKYEGTRLGRQELEAELLEDVEGALWSLDMIERARVSAAAVPDLSRIVVAIDPAGSVGEESDETAIVVAGVCSDGTAYVIVAISGKWLPPEWAAKAIGLYRRHKADRIVAEKNFGGDMVESTIRAVDPGVSFRAVSASRGKLVRAEPVAALFEQNKVKIAGSFPKLEDELCSYCGEGKSPNLLDAAVWALTELALASRTDGIIDFYRELVEEDRERAAVPGSVEAQREPANVAFLAPEGVSNFFAMSGRHICVGADRLVRVSARDATPLRQAGWQEVEHVPLT
jgi:predicted phage terminase large subunit-like protein